MIGLIIYSVIVTLLLMVTSYLVIIQNNKVETYEQRVSELESEIDEYTENTDTFLVQLHSQLTSVLAQIRDIDLRGAFEAEDEVGSTFQGIKAAIETLNPYVSAIQEENGQNKEQVT